MTDDELQARLRRLAAAPEKDARFWDELAANVRAGYARQVAARRRRRWLAAPVAAAGVALAAALTLWVRAPRPTPPLAPTIEAPALEADELGAFGDVAPDEVIDELGPAELDRVAQAFKKGA